MANGYPLYCYDEFNSIELYPQYTGEYESSFGMITMLPTPPSIPSGYQFEGWYYDQEFSDPVIIGTSWKVTTGKDPKVIIYAKWIEIENATVNSKMTALADEIRILSGTTDPMGLDAMTEHISDANDEVDAQVELLAQAVSVLEGKAGVNSEAVFEAGKKAEYDAFWDAFQENGNRASYVYGFAGNGWSENTFIPKYDIRPTNAANIFSGSGIKNLKSLLEKAGVVLDMSNTTALSYFMQYSQTTHIPVLDLRNVANLSYLFLGNSVLVYIEKIILKDDGSQTFGTYSFNNNPNLEELRIEGIIGQNGLSFAQSTKLSHDSLMSIINALQTKTSGTWTVTLGATNLAKLTDTEKAIATERGWTLA